MNISLFFEFPGILITIGAVLLMISIILIIIAYKTSPKMPTISYDNNMSEITDNENSKEAEPFINTEDKPIDEPKEINFFNNSESVNEKDNDKEKEEEKTDMFEKEFNNNSTATASDSLNNTPVKPEQNVESDEEEIELL